MNFKEVLNKYLKELNCSSKKLSNESGLSESVISRYRSGERTPLKNSEQLNKLTKALFNIAKNSGKNKYTFDKIVSDFNSVLTSDDFDYTTFSNNLNTLITSLNINTHEMSKYIVFDASHISRIRYGKSRPSNPIEFSNKICSYIFNRYKNPDDINNLMMVIGCKKSDLSSEKIYSTLFNCSLFFTGVLSPLLYLLITDSDRPASSDNFFEEQSSSFKYIFKTSLNFIIHHSLNTIILYF